MALGWCRGLQTRSCCFGVDHRRGVVAMAAATFALTVASFAVEYFVINVFIMYFQVMSLVCNFALIRGVLIYRIEYFLPWLVVFILSVPVLPGLFIFAYVKDPNSTWAIVAMSVGIPACVLYIYFWVVVMSLFYRITDKDDEIFKEAARQKDLRMERKRQRQLQNGHLARIP